MNGIRIDPRIKLGQASQVQAITAYKLALALELDIEALMIPRTPPAPHTGHGAGRRRVRADDPPSTRATR